MKSSLLISHRWKTPGWILTLPAVAAGLYFWFREDFEYWPIVVPKWADQLLWIDQFTFGSPQDAPVTIYILDEVITLALLVGLLLLAFSREKLEDEYIQRIRLESLQWAILINAVLLILFTVFVHGSPFFSVMTFNMFTPLLIFVGRFYYIILLKPLISKS